MEWLSSNWLALALVLLVLIALAAFGAGGRGERTPRAGGCCGGMEHDNEAGGRGPSAAPRRS
jgi:hypothetical protein